MKRDPTLDRLLTALKKHAVRYEDEVIRVVSVSIAAGATEKVHHRRLPPVFDRSRQIPAAADARCR